MTQFIDTLVGVQRVRLCPVGWSRAVCLRRDDLRGLLPAVPRDRQGVGAADPAAHGLRHDPRQPPRQRRHPHAVLSSATA